MKKIVLATSAFALALVTVAPVGATPAPVPEPSSFVQLAAGLFVLGGLALVMRKLSVKSEAK